MAYQFVLAGDVGATKTTLALFGPQEVLLRENTYENKMFNSFQALVSSFLAGLEYEVCRACFGVAGPVKDNLVRMTNLDWTLDSCKLANQFSFDQVILVNDLVATAAGAVLLPEEMLITLNAARPAPGGTIGVLAPGTGLGQAFGVQLKNRLLPLPSEGGHSSFAPRNKEQIALLEFMLTQHSHVSVEQVCSGRAISDLYTYIISSCPEPEWINKILAETEDPTPIIVKAANDALAGGVSCEPAIATLQLFVDILAGESANFALKVLATGGIYIGGGMAYRVRSFFDRDRFMRIFCNGVYREMLSDIPIYVITNPNTALIGARSIAMAGD